MKITIARRDLHAAVSAVGRAVAAQSTLQSLRSILLQLKDGALRLTATDLELTIETAVAADCKAGPGVAVPAVALREIVAALPEADVTLTTTDDGKTVEIACRRSRYNLAVLPETDFPVTDDITPEATVGLDRVSLAGALRLVEYAASDDDTRPILTGILFRLYGDKLTVAATNTHVLGVAEVDIPDPQLGLSSSYLVPARACQEFLRSLRNGDEPTVNLEFAQQHVCLLDGGTNIASRLIDGQFPRFERVIPDPEGAKLIWSCPDAPALLAAAKRVRLVAKEAAAMNRIIINFEGDEAVLTAETETGRAEERVPVDVTFDGEPFGLAVNADYLLAMLGAIGDGGVSFAQKENLTPIRVTCGIVGFTGVIMPMQI